MADYHIQIQTLEVSCVGGTSSWAMAHHTLQLLRTTRIYTHTAIHVAPNPFLIIAVNSIPGPPLVLHLVQFSKLWLDTVLINHRTITCLSPIIMAPKMDSLT